MGLSNELNIPVIAVVQANRGGVSTADDDKMPDLEDIRDSDGIGHVASRVISLKHKVDDVLEMCVKKNRYGKMGDRLIWQWLVNTGDFKFIESRSSNQRRERRSEDKSDTKLKNSRNVF